ncbi:hypothetical protein [Parvibaculum sp.]|nr:hypothetical protein [Parvibaculum sp.]HUD50377.1 hypothetical protein [Parvibaculum sp.]
MLIRNETAGDIPAISRLITEALAMLAQSNRRLRGGPRPTMMSTMSKL